MRFIYTEHALERMAERNVSRLEVEEAVRNPAVVLPGKQPGTNLVYLYTSDERRLGIVFKPKGRDTVLVITAYWS